MSTASQIRKHPLYADYVELRAQRETRGETDSLRAATRDVTGQIVDDLARNGVRVASAQIAQAYARERNGLRPQGRPRTPDGKAGLRERIETLEHGIARALLALRSGDADKARHELRAVMPGKGRAA